MLGWFVPVADSLTVFGLLATIAMGAFDAALRRDSRALPAIAASAAAATLWTAHLLAYPGVTPGAHPLITVQTSAVIFLVAAILTPSLLAWALIARGRPLKRGVGAAVGWPVAGSMGLLAMLVTMAPRAPAVLAGDRFTPFATLLVLVVLLPCLVAITVLFLGPRGDGRATRFTGLALAVLAADAFAVLLIRSRNEPLWFAYHSVRVLLVGVLLLGQLNLLRHSVKATRRRIDDLTALHEALRTFVLAAGSVEVRQAIVAAAGKLFGGDSNLWVRACLFRVLGGRADLVAQFDSRGRRREDMRFPIESHPTMREAVECSAARARPVRELVGAGVPGAAALADAGFESFGCVPVTLDPSKGSVLVVAGSDPRLFDGEALQLLESVGQMARLATLNAETFERVEASERELRVVVDSSLDAIITASDRGVITGWNPAAERLFGWESREIVGRSMAGTLVPPEARAGYRRDLKRLGASRRSRLGGQVMEMTALHKDGRKIPIELAVSASAAPGSRTSLVAFAVDIAARQRAESELRASEERYRLLVSGIADHAIFMLNPQGLVASWNAGAERIQGYHAEEIMGRHLSAFYLEEDVRAGRPTHMLQEAATAGSYEEDGWRVRRDGSRFWANALLTPVRGDRGQLVGFANVTRDISERRAAEIFGQIQFEASQLIAEASSVEEVSAALLGLVGASVGWELGEFWSWNPLTSSLELSTTWARVAGSAAAAVGEAGRTLAVLPDHGPLGRVLASSEPAWIEDVRSEPEFPRSALAAAAGLRGAIAFPVRWGAELIGVLCFFGREPLPAVDRALLDVMLDVGLRLGLFIRKRRSEDEVHAIVDKSPLGICRVNGGQLVAPNQALCAMLDYSPEQLEAKPLLELAHPDDLARIRELYESLVERRAERFQMDCRLVAHRGRVLWGSLTVSAVRDGHGRLLYSIAMVEDIDERKQAEEALQELNQELKRSNQDLEQFAYVASHDLQEPLRQISSYVQLLSRRYRGQLDPDADDFIGYAVDGAGRMQSLIRDLLEYGRVGNRGVSLKPVNAGDALQQALANLAAAVTESQALVVIGRLPMVLADTVQLTQLFQNLVGNALKFTSLQRPRVEIDAERNGSEWIISVRDNGIGVEPESAERIFTIFQRLHQRDRYPGTGIGLAICKKIVDRHGGKIWVESAPGHGSAFRFTITGAATPIVSLAAVAGAPPAGRRSPPRQGVTAR